MLDASFQHANGRVPITDDSDKFAPEIGDDEKEKKRSSQRHHSGDSKKKLVSPGVETTWVSSGNQE